ncbi:DUF998 domain-containing protein [Candidatus Thorarchaeota archaeon]|nr:MAG: DUF998 domain-containing protein [Candidatus Thorarchaeota archaeon]
MKTTIRKWPIVTLSGLLVILLYCIFTITSWALYPEPYGPLTHYLSRLGNFDYSPLGAYFYNLGCILTGVALIPFFLSLRIWVGESKPQVVLLLLGQLIGVLSACALIMIGIFSEDQGAPHMTASSTFFVLNFVVLILVNIALLWHKQFIKPIALYGIAICVLSLGFEISIGGPIVEWFTVFGSLIFVALISINSLKINENAK